jgi:HEAT repeat protein
MKKIHFILIFLVVSFVKLSAQTDAVNSTIQHFPYQHLADANASLNSMQTWSKGDWKKLLSQLDDTDSLRLKPSLALSAYVHSVALDGNLKSSTAATLSSALKYVKSFYGRSLIIQHLAYLGDDAAVKTLSKLLADETFVGNAARALAIIHSEVSVAALNKYLKKADEPARKHIQAALDNVNFVLPEIKSAPLAKKIIKNNVQQLLQLQDQLAASPNPLQKQHILSAAAHIPSFNSLMIVGRSLSDPDVQEEAALIIARMALADKNIRGKAVREVLEQALPLIKGADSAFLVPLLKAHLALMPYDNGFTSIFNGKDIVGWKALVGNPIARSKMSAAELQNAQKLADEKTRGDWVVKDGLLIFTGHGDNLATEKQYGDFEMFVDWKITAKGDAGIYLRGSPQVQIWDTSRREVGAQVGSGGLYNNQKNQSKPLVVADNPIGQWNTFHIIMKGDRVTVYLNGVLVTDNTILENYWNRNLPIFAKEQIELQAHGTYVAYRNIYLREIPTNTISILSEEEKKDGFTMLFDGTNMDQWMGNTEGYRVEEGVMVVHPDLGHGNLYTKDEYANFEYRFEFQLTPGSNNGLGIRAPLNGDAAYVGMELQILDNEAAMYKNLQPYQYHGSVYGVIPAKRGYLLPTGEWNKEEVVVNGTKIKVTLNGTVILDGDIKEASLKGTADHKEHPGLQRTTGHIGYLGHGDVMRFKNIRVKKI